MSTVKTNNVQIGQSVTATNNFTWYQPASPDGTVRLGNGNSGSVTDLVTLTSAGNLGIGTSSPSGKLNVVANGKFGQFTPSTTGTAGYLAFSSDSGFTTARSLIGVDNSSGNGLWSVGGAATALSIGTVDSFPIVFATGNTEKMRLDSSGNLGLGVTPSAWSGRALQVGSGASIFTNSIANAFILSNAYYDGSNFRYVNSSTATYYSQNNGVGSHVWSTAPSGTAGNAISFTQAMTLDASGVLQVGITNATAGRINAYKNLSSTTRTSNVTLWLGTNGSGADNTIQLTDNVAYNYYFGGYNGTAYVSVNNSNGVKIASGASAWSADSDERLKTDLKPIENAIQKVFTLRSVTGRYKTDEESVSRSFLIAQDVQAVLPEAIDATDPENLGVRYTETIPLLVAAIKELSAELNLLKQKVNA